MTSRVAYHPDGTQFFPNTRPQASAGNPGLVPIQSFNIDLSFEWYYADGSYLSVGYFDKDVENFIGTGRESGTTFEIPNIVGGALWNRAIADSGLDPNNYTAVGRYILDNYQDDPAVDGETITSVAGDPSIVFDLSRPVNQRTAKVDGIEVNLQHNFGDSGYGFIVNATLADADVAYDNFNSLEGQFVLNGLSDSANLIGFYDGEDLQVRLAYNWRDDFHWWSWPGRGHADQSHQYRRIRAVGSGNYLLLQRQPHDVFLRVESHEETRHVYSLTKARCCRLFRAVLDMTSGSAMTSTSDRSH